ncbi:hypothetical protein pb186bvf_020084 [Paramecium bursaria]
MRRRLNILHINANLKTIQQKCFKTLYFFAKLIDLEIQEQYFRQQYQYLLQQNKMLIEQSKDKSPNSNIEGLQDVSSSDGIIESKFNSGNNGKRRRKNISKRQSKQLRRRKTIVSNEKILDNILSFKNYIPVLQNKPQGGQELIPQWKLDEIFLAAQQSLSENESSSSGSYVIVNESQLTRLKRALFRERVEGRLLKEKLNKIYEQVCQNLDQFECNEQNNVQPQDSNQQSSQHPRYWVSKLDQGSHGQLLQETQEVLVSENEQYQVRQIPRQVEFADEAIYNYFEKLQDPKMEQLKKQQPRFNKQQVRKTIQKSKKQQLKQIQQRKQNSDQISDSQIYISGSKRLNQGRILFKSYVKDNQPYSQRKQVKQDSQIEQRTKVYITESGNKYHKFTCRALQGNVVSEELSIYNAKQQYKPCRVCFP